MAYELIIDASPEGEKIALLQDKKLVELHEDKSDDRFLVGEIYLGRVKKIMPGLNAAFIDIGHKKDAFLHYHDLGPFIKSWIKITKQSQEGSRKNGDLTNFKLEPETLKTGKIGDLLKRNQQILVQVAKEPISSKGPRLTTEISIAGKYFILVPFHDGVSMSKKVSSNEERKRLKTLASSLRTPQLGLICRTAAEHKGGQALHQDILELHEKWEKIFNRLPNAQVKERIVGEASKSFSIVRDMLSYPFTSIVVNNKTVFDELKSKLQTVNDELPKKLRLYNGKERIFSHFGIDKEIKASFGTTVSCPGGSYLIIEHTEAMHTIDVNSGSKQNRSKSQEENALATDLDAAGEIARQLRLRDMGGIIVIDFIDLRTPAFKKELYNTLKNAMESDDAKHTILPMSKFGLVQITRQRVRPAMSVSVTEKCPACQGTGKVTSSLLIIDEIQKHLDYLITKAKHKKLSLTTNPYLAAYIKSGFPSLRMKWFSTHKKWVGVKSESTCGMLEYYFQDAEGELIDLDK